MPSLLRNDSVGYSATSSDATHKKAPHLLNEPLQLVSEFAEVAGGDESQSALLQTVTGQFNYLVVGKAEHAICQWEDALRRVAADDLLNLLLHLSCCLQQEGEVQPW